MRSLSDAFYWIYRFTKRQWCRRGGLGGSELPSCDLMGAQPPKSINLLELSADMNHFSVINGYFRFKKLWRNRYITRYKVVKLRCLLENIIICLYRYVDLASMFLIKMHARTEPP